MVRAQLPSELCAYLFSAVRLFYFQSRPSIYHWREGLMSLLGLNPSDPTRRLVSAAERESRQNLTSPFNEGNGILELSNRHYNIIFNYLPAVEY